MDLDETARHALEWRTANGTCFAGWVAQMAGLSDDDEGMGE